MKRSVVLAAAAALVPLLAAPPAGAISRRAGTSATLPAPAGTARPCDEGRWPVSVQGQPRGFEAGPAGYYVWHDASGWHLRTTTPASESHGFSGRITASEPIRLVHAYRNEPGDTVAVSGRTLSFSFNTHNHVDGVDFTVGCAGRLRFELSGEGSRWPARRIRLGVGGHARSNPFTVVR